MGMGEYKYFLKIMLPKGSRQKYTNAIRINLFDLKYKLTSLLRLEKFLNQTDWNTYVSVLFWTGEQIPLPTIFTAVYYSF